MINTQTNTLTNTLTRLSYVVIASLALLISANATASTVTLQMDINSLTVQAYDGNNGDGNPVVFGGTTHTGSLDLGIDTTGNDPTQLVSISIDGTQQFPTPVLSVSGLAGYINLINGQIQDGHIRIDVDDADIDTYQFDIVSQSGFVIDYTLFNYGYVVAGNTSNGDFSSDTFGDINVAPWANNEPLFGSFYQFSFNPDSTGFDQNVDMDITVIATVAVPLPASVWPAMILLGALGLGIARRRQSLVL